MIKKDETPEEFYISRLNELNQKRNMVNEKRKRIAWQRMLVVFLTVLLMYESWQFVSIFIRLLEAAIGFAVFLYVVSIDTNTKEKLLNLHRLISITEDEIKACRNEYLHRETGIEYLPPHHPYAEDLDLFGTASLYQYINRCSSQQGRQLLADRLLQSLSKTKIETEAEAAVELKNNIKFIQQLQALGNANAVTIKTEKNIHEWLKMQPVFTHKKWTLLSLLFPLLTACFVVLYITNILPAELFALLLFICYLIASGISAKINPTYEKLSKLANEIETVHQQLSLIERETFSSKKLLQLRASLTNANGDSATREVQKLHLMVNRFDIRLNHFAFLFLNTFLLWDLHQLLALNKWKQRNKSIVANWFQLIAEIEYSCSLAILSFNHPDWCLPEINDTFFSINGDAIGHPLLAKNKRVNNSFSLAGKGKIAIITGSNMGGKSTFLRSLGVNTVLALMGAPVCAESFSVSEVKLMSSMRITDNLSENASTFYAELKKLKAIIEAANKEEKIFILLDEMLRGTNSLDRHTGSVALLQQLIRKEAIAVIATHDVELAKLENTFPTSINNYHFDVQAEGNELYFDYKLKRGVCKSLNASVLMKNIGIELT